MAEAGVRLGLAEYGDDFVGRWEELELLGMECVLQSLLASSYNKH